MSASNVRAYLRELPRSTKRAITIGVDVASVAAALLVTVQIQPDAAAMVSGGHGGIFALALLSAIPVVLAFRLYQNVVRYMGSGMLFTVVSSVTAATVLFWGLLKLSGIQGLSHAALILHWLLTLLFVGGSRVVASEFLREKKSATELLDRTIIYGAGDAGAQLANSLKGKSGLKVVAFVDDNKDLSGSLV